MLLRSRTRLRSSALAGAVLAALILMGGATGARAASEAANNALFGKPRTQRARSTPAPTRTPTRTGTPSFPVPASARPQRTGTTGTSTAGKATRALPGISTPHIATTTPRGIGAAPAGALTTPTTGTSPALATTATSSIAPPRAAGAPLGATGIPPRPTATLRPVTHERTSLSPVAIVAGVLALLLILICLAWGAARWYAYEPHWTVSLRHSFAEAGLRLSSTWEELGDWTRLGR